MMELNIDSLIRGGLVMIRIGLPSKGNSSWHLKRPFGVAVALFPSNSHYMAYTSLTIPLPPFAISFILEIGGIISGMEDG